MTVLIDSWAWIEYWRGGPRSSDAGRFVEGEDEALVSAINVAEVYHWVLLHYDQKVADAKRRAVESRCFVIPLDADLAATAARVKEEERLALADSIVLATGRAHRADVVTGDPDLRGKAGVIYIGP